MKSPKDRPDLSPKQRELLKMLEVQRAKTGMTPTQRELVRLLGITQTAVRDRLVTLARKGYILLLPRLSRGIVIVERNP
jgi:DNA-binding FadR family transcriptional regulator